MCQLSLVNNESHGVVGCEDGSEIRSGMVTIEARPGAIPCYGAKGNEVRARAAAAQ